MNQYDFFDNKAILLELIKKRPDLKLLETDNTYSIRGNYFKGNRDDNMIDIYKKDSEVFFVHRIDTTPLEKSSLFSFYNTFTFHLLDIEIVKQLFTHIYEMAHDYKIYKKYNTSNHFHMIKNMLNDKKVVEFINIKIPYDVSASLSTGRGSGNTGATNISKLYKINRDGSISEHIDIHFPIKSTDKLSVRLINIDGVHKIYYSFKKDDDYVYADMETFDTLIKKQFFECYQSAVKKHLNIKNADYNEDYITVLQMIKI